MQQIRDRDVALSEIGHRSFGEANASDLTQTQGEVEGGSAEADTSNQSITQNLLLYIRKSSDVRFMLRHRFTFERL